MIDSIKYIYKCIFINKKLIYRMNNNNNNNIKNINYNSINNNDHPF